MEKVYLIFHGSVDRLHSSRDPLDLFSLPVKTG